MADDLGWSNVGYHNEHAKTPHIDRLVREGIELDRHYVYYYVYTAHQPEPPF